MQIRHVAGLFKGYRMGKRRMATGEACAQVSQVWNQQRRLQRCSHGYLSDPSTNRF